MQEKGLVNTSEKYIREFNRIVEAAEKSGNLEHDRDSSYAQKVFEFSQVSHGKGKAVYLNFSDEDLCNLLREKARQLEHVPAQKEFYWLYRVYIKKRFGNWPKALIAAGLSKKAGTGGDSYEKIQNNKNKSGELLKFIKEKSIELGRPPHMHEMPEIAEFFKSKYTTWAELLDAADVCMTCKTSGIVNKIDILNQEDKILLELIYNKALELGRAPMRNEIDLEIRAKLKNTCGTWRNILYQIELEPIQKIRPFSTTYLDGNKGKHVKHRDILEGSLFKLVNPDESVMKNLNWIKRQSTLLGRPLIKQEIPKGTYENLINKCISYRNILFQIGLEPLELSKEKEIVKQLRRKSKTKIATLDK